MDSVESGSPARLLSWTEPCPGIAIFRVGLDRDFIFSAGQHAILRLTHKGGTISRPYSIASSPSERRVLEFYVNLVEKGRLTPTLWEPDALQALRRRDPQTQLSILGPEGSFVLPPEERRNLILVASGTGLAPFMSILREMYEDSLKTPQRLRPRSACLVHGVRHPEHLGYREELQALAAAEDPEGRFSLTYVPAVSRPGDSPSWEGLQGRAETLFEPSAERGPGLVTAGEIVRKMLRTMAFPSTHAVLVCGHAGTVENMKRLLAVRGYRPGKDLLYEK